MKFGTVIWTSFSLIASVFFTDSITEDNLRLAYYSSAKDNAEKVRVLIVPGHDDEYWGTDYKGVKEAELTVQMGEILYAQFRKNNHFDVTLARTKSGYNPILLDYFDQKRREIQEFIRTQKDLMNRHLAEGRISSRVIVRHNKAPSKVVHRLYGINKWANENGIDIVIHIHFNDYPRQNRTKPGTYKGFSIYIPERQYSNSKGSHALAQYVFDRLSKKYPISNLSSEDEGLIEDQKLIGIGAFNTLDGAGMYIEYAYIYEPILQGRENRKKTMESFAEETYLGMMDFFEADKHRVAEEKLQDAAVKENYRFFNPIGRLVDIDLGPGALFGRVINLVKNLEGI